MLMAAVTRGEIFGWLWPAVLSCKCSFNASGDCVRNRERGTQTIGCPSSKSRRLPTASTAALGRLRGIVLPQVSVWEDVASWAIGSKTSGRERIFSSSCCSNQPFALTPAVPTTPDNWIARLGISYLLVWRGLMLQFGSNCNAANTLRN